MEHYQYPDHQDRITAKFIEQHEPYPGYWAESEAHALEKLEEYLYDSGLAPNQSLSILDVGAGEGRLLPWIGRYAQEVTAQDLDDERLATAKKTYGESANYLAEPITNLSEASFDLLICSHVLQHVPSTEFEPLLLQMRRLAKPGGVLVLLFSRGAVGNEQFRVATVGNDTLVDKTEFDATLKYSPEGELPFRLFDPEKLKQTARDLGWTPEWEWTFHILEKNDSFGMTVEKRDELVNATPSLSRQFGRDMMMVWRRGDS